MGGQATLELHNSLIRRANHHAGIVGFEAISLQHLVQRNPIKAEVAEGPDAVPPVALACHCLAAGETSDPGAELSRIVELFRLRHEGVALPLSEYNGPSVGRGV